MKIARVKYLPSLAVLLIASGVATAAELKPFTATYELSRNGDPVGTTVLTLRQTPAGWDLQSADKGTHGTAAWLAANVQEDSQVVRSAGTIEMRSYTYRLSTLASHKHETIIANPASHGITVQDDKHDHAYPMEPGVVDKLSLTLAIAQDLANGKRGSLTYPVAGRDHIDPQQYEVGKEERLTVPAGAQRTIAVNRVSGGANGKSTSYWFGLDNGFVPVRIVHSDKDGTEEMRLASLTR